MAVLLEVAADVGKNATLCHVDVSVREFRNHTARVIDAVESGARVRNC